jgi:hypothetical protein
MTGPTNERALWGYQSAPIPRGVDVGCLAIFESTDRGVSASFRKSLPR